MTLTLLRNDPDTLVITEAMPSSVGPRKRLLPLREFLPGDMLHSNQSGENLLALRQDERGLLVRRARGSARAAALNEGDLLIRICSVDLAEWGYV